MVFALAFVLAATQVPSTELPVRILARGGEFQMRSGAKFDRIPIRSAALPTRPPSNWPPERVLFRKDAAYAVWDSRGLSVRQGSWVFTSQLTEIPLSPKLFSREEIARTKLLIEGGVRKVAVSKLSGALRDGPKAYFLTRWEESDGKPWLEALVVVALDEEKPKPRLVGRFEGASLDLAPNQSRLFIRDGKPSAWVQVFDPEGTSRSFGLAIYDPESAAFRYEIVGERPEKIDLVDGRIGWFLGRTDYGAQILHRWDAKSMTRRELLETRGSARLMDDRTPWIAVVHEDEGSFLHNLETGGRLRLPAKPGFRWCAFGVAVWSPASRPVKAVVYDPVRWEVLGRWNADSRPPDPGPAPNRKW